MNKQTQVLAVVGALVGLGLVFLVGDAVFFGGGTAAAISDFGLYAIAFATGAWSALTVAFVLNYVSVYRWDERAIGFDPRIE